MVFREPDPSLGQRVTGAVSYEMAFGTYEDALAMIGVRGQPRVAGLAVGAGRIQLFAATVRDPNPAYWDAGFAERTWGRRAGAQRPGDAPALLAPPALLMGWLIPPRWDPSGGRPQPSIAIRVPLPGTSFVNASNDVEFLDPIVEGDRLTVVDEVVSVSPEKRTRLGVGHFVETLETYYRDDGELVARNRNTLFRFTPEAPA